ncbi:unnamed protein product, partial [Effrenium voratum]
VLVQTALAKSDLEEHPPLRQLRHARNPCVAEGCWQLGGLPLDFRGLLPKVAVHWLPLHHSNFHNLRVDPSWFPRSFCPNGRAFHGAGANAAAVLAAAPRAGPLLDSRAPGAALAGERSGSGADVEAFLSGFSVFQVLFIGWRAWLLDSAAPSRIGRPESVQHFARPISGFQQQAETLFFSPRPARPLRVQVTAAAKADLLARWLRRSLRMEPARRCVVFVPWIQGARRLQEQLAEREIESAVLAHDTALRATDQVVLCTFRSAKRLLGQSFGAKIIDEAHHLARKTRTKALIHDQIPAQRSAELSPTFKAEADVRHSLQDAMCESALCPIEGFLLPLAADRDTQLGWLARFIEDNKARWSPMAVLFGRVAAAEAFAAQLAARGVRAASVCAADGPRRRRELHRQLARGEIDALTMVRASTDDSGIPGLRTVVFAEPARQHTSLHRLRVLLHSAQVPGKHIRLVDVVDAGLPGAHQNDTAAFARARRRAEEFASLGQPVGVAAWDKPQLLDLYGRTFDFSEANFWDLLARQGRPVQRTRPWIRSLHAWLMEHRRLPSRSGGEERLAEWLQKARRRARDGELGEKDMDLWAVCEELLTRIEEEPSERKKWLRSLQAWVVQAGRKPNLLSEDAVERRQARRWQNAARYLQHGRLDEAEQQVFASCQRVNLQNRKQLRDWLQELCLFLEERGRLPSRGQLADSHEHRQAVRLHKARKALRQKKLSAVEAERFSKALALTENDEKAATQPRQWLQELSEFLQRNGKPKREEKLMTKRWAMARAELRQNSLSDEELQMLEPWMDQLRANSAEPVEVRSWVQELVDWIHREKRLPSRHPSAEQEERSQGVRLKNARAMRKKGSLSEAEVQLLTGCKGL